jgi:hypothetical protein
MGINIVNIDMKSHVHMGNGYRKVVSIDYKHIVIPRCISYSYGYSYARQLVELQTVMLHSLLHALLAKKTKSTPAHLASLRSCPYPFCAPHPLP